MKVHFLLISEGPSDKELIPHLSSLLVDCSVEEATGAAPDFNRLPYRVSKDIESKVRAVLELEDNADLLFIHRDADSPDSEPRYREISIGVEKAGCQNSWIGVVPVQAIEAWLLLNKNAIRRISGRPNGKVPLDLPAPNHIENLAHPKERLFEAIRTASETTGRQRDRLNRKIFSLRTQLIGELKVGGDLCQLPSWARLKEDVIRYVETVEDK